MPSWSQRYSATAQLTQQEPVYLLMLLDHYGSINSLANLGDGAYAFAIPVAYTFAEHGGPVILFSPEGWELTEPYDWTIRATPTSLVSVFRAKYGTQQTDIGKRDSIGTVGGMFSTGVVANADPSLSIKTGHMSMPSGLGQLMDLVNGRLTTDAMRVDIQDRNGEVTKLMESNPMIGRHAILLGGYAGMTFTDYSFIYAGRIDEVTIREGGIYNISFDDPTRKLSKKLFGYLDTWYDNVADGGITSGEINWFEKIRGHSILYDTTNDPVMQAYYAGHYLKVNDEYARLNTNGVWHDPMIRGQLGTEAAAHSGDGDGDAVSLMFAIEDNPIDVLLGFLLTDDSYTLPRDFSNMDGSKLTWDGVYSALGSIGLGVKRADLDLESFETIRNEWFPDYVVRIIITRGESMKPFIEKHLLKPYGLCLYINNYGQIALGIMRPALPVTSLTPTLNADDIIGIPEIKITAGDIINEVTANYDYDEIDRSYGSDTTAIDAGSQSTYDYHGVISIDARGLVTDFFAGQNKALSMARRKRQRFSDPNPAIPLEVLISNKNIEPMSIVRVTHDGLPDPYAGTIGWDKFVLVVGKRVRWNTGTLILDVVDTAYFGKRYCTIAPNGLGDYVDETDANRTNYGFIADADDQLSDGTDAYQIM